MGIQLLTSVFSQCRLHFKSRILPVTKLLTTELTNGTSSSQLFSRKFATESGEQSTLIYELSGRSHYFRRNSNLAVLQAVFCLGLACVGFYVAHNEKNKLDEKKDDDSENLKPLIGVLLPTMLLGSLGSFIASLHCRVIPSHSVKRLYLLADKTLKVRVDTYGVMGREKSLHRYQFNRSHIEISHPSGRQNSKFVQMKVRGLRQPFYINVLDGEIKEMDLFENLFQDPDDSVKSNA